MRHCYTASSWSCQTAGGLKHECYHRQLFFLVRPGWSYRWWHCWRCGCEPAWRCGTWYCTVADRWQSCCTPCNAALRSRSQQLRSQVLHSHAKQMLDCCNARLLLKQQPFLPPSRHLSAVVLAVLAFFALRPGKGWLRRKPAAAAAAAAAAAGGGKWGKETPTPGSSTAGSDAALGGQPANGGIPSAAPPPAAAVAPLQAAWTSSSLGQDTFLPYSRAPPSSLAGPDTLLPYSRAAGAPPISQAGVAAPTEPAAAPPSSMSSTGWPAGQPTPQPLPPSYISSAGLPTTPAAGSAALAGMTASRSSG